MDYGLLQPLVVPNLKFEFIVGFLNSQRNFYSTMIVVDRLTKITHFIPTISIVTAYGVAELFMREIFKHHGIL